MQPEILATKLIVKVVPDDCPFARKFKVFNQSVKLPPLCKLNPWYDNIMALRFRALCLLEKQ